MKKFYLSFVFLLISFISTAQNSYNIITDKVRIDHMIWSDTDDKFLFFPKTERHFSKVIWEFTLNENSTGIAKVTELEDGDKYAFNIYNWEVKQDEHNRDYVWMDAIQTSNSEKVTIMVNSNDLKQQMISVFLPDSKVCIFFDNMNF